MNEFLSKFSEVITSYTNKDWYNTNLKITELVEENFDSSESTESEVDDSSNKSDIKSDFTDRMNAIFENIATAKSISHSLPPSIDFWRREQDDPWHDSENISKFAEIPLGPISDAHTINVDPFQPMPWTPSIYIDSDKYNYDIDHDTETVSFTFMNALYSIDPIEYTLSVGNTVILSADNWPSLCRKASEYLQRLILESITCEVNVLFPGDNPFDYPSPF